MGHVVRKKTNPRQAIRIRKKSRIRRKLGSNWGLSPRLVVYRSNKFLYAQVVDDSTGNTVAQANTQEEPFAKLKSQKDVAAATQLGKLVGERAKTKKVDKVTFDRNGYEYHGRIKAIADGAREAGLRF